jgi:hypothetical protein
MARIAGLERMSLYHLLQKSLLGVAATADGVGAQPEAATKAANDSIVIVLFIKLLPP